MPPQQTITAVQESILEESKQPNPQVETRLAS
jgi:hypothetical protein